MIGGSPIPMYSQPPYGMPYGGSPYGVPYAGAPQPRPSYLPTPPYAGQFAPPASPVPMQRPFAGNPAPAAPPVGTGWQGGPPQSLPPVLAMQAAGPQQPKLRGSIPDASPPLTRSIRLPSPTELGLSMPIAHAIALPSPTELGLLAPTNAGHH